MYDNIDMKQTGALLKKIIEKSGYTVKDIQEMLHLSCPQPVYRWYKGKILPSVDHLYVLSRLLKVHMEDLLVSKCEKDEYKELYLMSGGIVKRLYAYWNGLQARVSD